MKTQILNTMRLAFALKLLTKNEFFTLAPLPDFIKTKDTNGQLDLDIEKSAPKDYTYKFFISKNSTELRLGNFYAVEVLQNTNRILITQHLSYEDKDPVLLNDECCISSSVNGFGCSKDLIDYLVFLFSTDENKIQ